MFLRGRKSVAAHAILTCHGKSSHFQAGTGHWRRWRSSLVHLDVGAVAAVRKRRCLGPIEGLTIPPLIHCDMRPTGSHLDLTARWRGDLGACCRAPTVRSSEAMPSAVSVEPPIG